VDYAYFTVHVSPAAEPLSANANPENQEYEGIINYPIQLYGSAQGGEPPYTYKWNLGDGSTSNTNNPIHTYKNVKEYDAILTVTDNIGTTAQDKVIIKIYKDKLTAYSGEPYIGNTEEEILFKGEAAGGLEPYYYIWDFGNGNIIQEQNPTYIFDKQSTYNIIFVVIDSNGNIDKETVKVQTIKNQNPDDEPEILKAWGGLGIKARIKTGNSICRWKITVEGEHLRHGGEKSGTLLANREKTIRTGFTTRAIGRVNILITAGYTTKEYKAFAIGPFYLLVRET
jgi:hypothetical protein